MDSDLFALNPVIADNEMFSLLKLIQRTKTNKSHEKKVEAKNGGLEHRYVYTVDALNEIDVD